MDDGEEEDEGDQNVKEERIYPVILDSVADLASIGLEKGVEKEWIEVEWEVQKNGKDVKQVSCP